MFSRFREYLKYGAGRPPGTMWAMERSYFEFVHKYPGRDEHAYIRLALQARYPLRKDISEIANRCSGLDDAIAAAVELDFGLGAARLFRPALDSFPMCSACGKYRSLSNIDSLCFGCRTFGSLVPCHNCRLYWDSREKFCRRCGAPLCATESLTGAGTIARGHVSTEPTQEAHNFIPRFNFTEDELAAFGTTHFMVGQWKRFTESEACDWTLGIVQNLVEKSHSSRGAIDRFYFPLQLLLMSRRAQDFCEVQKMPAFSARGQGNFRRLCHALNMGGEDGFRDQWRRLFGSESDMQNLPEPIVQWLGGSGESKDDPVVLSAVEPRIMISSEYWYLSYVYGRRGQDWDTTKQVLLNRDDIGKRYDILKIELADRSTTDVFFDISHLTYRDI